MQSACCWCCESHAPARAVRPARRPARGRARAARAPAHAPARPPARAPARVPDRARAARAAAKSHENSRNILYLYKYILAKVSATNSRVVFSRETERMEVEKIYRLSEAAALQVSN